MTQGVSNTRPASNDRKPMMLSASLTVLLSHVAAPDVGLRGAATLRRSRRSVVLAA